MAVSARALAGRIGYALVFCALLPVLLVLWARGTDEIVRLPAFGTTWLGFALVLSGAMMMAMGMGALWFHGGGWPMNAWPPPRLVTTGIYRLFSHPIYVGFSLASIGVSMIAGSASGLWLISPTIVLGCAALVLGYELHDLERRFGRASMQALRWLPANLAEAPTVLDRARCYVFAILPWIAAYEIVMSTGVPKHLLNTGLPLEASLPVWQWMEAFYASVYLVVLLCPLVIRTKRDLRTLTLRASLATALIFPLYFTIPTLALRRPFVPVGPLGRLLAWEQAVDPPVAALPSFHVVWAFLVAESLGVPRRSRRVWCAWASLVAVSCVMTGMHTVADVLAGVVAAALLIRAGTVWEVLRAASERLANSWREWRIGPVRIINHGFYAGSATFVALAIVSVLLGPGHEKMLVLTAAAGLAGAGIWAQWIEGSSRLLRPFGFYGGLLGVVAGACFAPLAGDDRWLILAAYCVAAPWLQSIGRLRCLVQGCCHGRLTVPEVGIRYAHPRSRVCRIAGLEGMPIHPTPLYSILWNALVALVVTRLWIVAAPLHLVGGVFLILSGIGRFVEEAYRGEPQTPIFAGLRLYQWIAAASVMIGAAITALAHSGSAVTPRFNWTGIGLAFLFGVMSSIALGVDFPDSNRRFARLA